MPKLVYTNSAPSPEEFRRDLLQAMARVNPVDDLIELTAELLDFERKYKMGSEDFYLRYQAGALADELQHCMEWADAYDTFIQTKRLIETALLRAAIQQVDDRVVA